MKKVLAINYSQTGQLDEIMERFLSPMVGVDVDRVKIQLKVPYGFPWDSDRFFEVMPESVMEEVVELQDFDLTHDAYDLIVLGYQPWFLSPSIPTTSLLKHEKFKAVIQGKPVVTVIGARNMWLNAQDSIRALLSAAGARQVANIPLIDRSNNLTSAVSILHWMLNGKKTRPMGIFPKPGVSDEDIWQADRYGAFAKKALETGEYDDLQRDVLSLDEIRIPTNILFIEMRAKKLFRIWARIIKKKGTTVAKRKRWLVGFKYYLIFALFVVSPIVLVIFNLFLRPFELGSIKRKKEYYCGVN
ncbi:hypothetical protein BFP72_02715 [Reichenbachiella sp. 5M10]|uniref:hypothetical protein n=1 Tax=Reichenbachiella sp. 5M10 TaxID=1889772 RepID=UPI000C15F428|nr:hypothetical protein [Reichenbachiella sp. 5M10]PIB34407.1 hypothetical protein BFP72_02715 [Reichenbachiella sp. 5M10]